MPYPRNACFTGRDEDLLALADALLYPDQTDQVTVTQMLAATGLGGMGKTQLAVEFCHRYGRYFEGVHWLNCRDGKLESEIATCGQRMGLQPWPEKQPKQVEITLRAWQGSRRRLLVLDNLEDPEVLRAWLPRLDRCRLLITARRPDWPAELGLRTHPLGLLSPVESHELLRRLAPRLQTFADAELYGIAEKLGRLPLALDLAGRYLSDRVTLAPAAFLQVLAEQENLLQHSSLLSWVEGGSPTGHETSLAATFQLSWQRLAGEDPASTLAREVFLLAGWCAPNTAIPRELLAQACGAPEEDFDRAQGRLAGLGLVDMTAGGLSLHLLLAAFARSLQPGGQNTGQLAALMNQLMRLSYKANETGLPLTFTPLRAHLEHLAPLAEEFGLKQAPVLWSNLGMHFSIIADLTGARVCYERALRIDEATYGKEHPEVARDVNNLGSVLQDQGDLAGARACYERALRIDEATYGKEHPEVARDVNNLGSVLKAQGDLAGARACFERALRIDEATYGKEHPMVAIRVNNLGSVLKAQGDLAGARACYERALRIDEATYGKEHPEVATDVNNLGSVLKAQGDLAGARACFERALRIDEATNGKEHPMVAIRVNNLGMVLHDQGDLAGARACYERALGIFEKFLPADHPSIKTVRENLELLIKTRE